jgi:hypothetical protein
MAPFQEYKTRLKHSFQNFRGQWGQRGHRGHRGHRVFFSDFRRRKFYASFLGPQTPKCPLRMCFAAASDAASPNTIPGLPVLCCGLSEQRVHQFFNAHEKKDGKGLRSKKTARRIGFQRRGARHVTVGRFIFIRLAILPPYSFGNDFLWAP